MTLAITSGVARADTLKFNGAEFKQIEAAPASVSFQSQNDPAFLETVTLRSLAANGTFDNVARAFVVRAKAESGGAKLRLMEKKATQELMVVYLKEIKSERMLYKVERLSAPKGALPVSISYSATFEIGDTSDEQDAKIKNSAIEAIAQYDMDRARTLLSPAI
jgi:hypothetical protein